MGAPFNSNELRIQLDVSTLCATRSFMMTTREELHELAGTGHQVAHPPIRLILCFLQKYSYPIIGFLPPICRRVVQLSIRHAQEAVRAKYGSADEFILHLFDRSKPQEDRDILVSSRILQANDVSGEEAALQVEWNWADGSTTTGPMTFVRIGNDWRQALNFDPPAVGKMNTGLQTEGAASANQPPSK